jgi:hypothetical protein
MLQARSSMARAGLSVCGDCSWGEIGQISRRMLIIRNHTKTRIILPVGARIGHVIFFYTGNPKFVYKGALQSTENLDEIARSWEPSNLLPKISERKYNINLEDRDNENKTKTSKILNPKHIVKPSKDLNDSTTPSTESDTEKVSLD